MKKIFFVTILMVFCIVTICFAEQKYSPNRPEWKDFCPFGLENISEYNTQKSLAGTDKHWQIKEYNYWVDRKKDFEKDLKTCDEITNDPENQNQCYAKLIDRQNRHNQSDVTPLQVWQNKKAQWQQATQIMQQQNYQQQQLNLQRQQLMMQQYQSMPKWSDVAPKQYNVNVNQTIRYRGF